MCKSCLLVFLTGLGVGESAQVEEMTGPTQLELVHDRAFGGVHAKELLPLQPTALGSERKNFTQGRKHTFDNKIVTI